MGNSSIVAASMDSLTHLLPPCGVSVDNEPDESLIIPDYSFRLEPPSPNPFNPSVKIQLTLEHPTFIDLGIFDLSGRHVCTLSKGLHAAGNISVTWQGRNTSGSLVSAGTYIVRLLSEGRSVSQKITLVK